MSKNLSELSGRKGLQENLFELIGRSAEANNGTPGNEELKKLAEDFLIGTANTYGTASFYDFTREENKGKKAFVCNGSACMLAGTQDEVKKKLGTKFKEEEIGEMCCLGRCHENSAFHVNGHNYSADAIDQLDQVVNGSNGLNLDSYAVASTDREILTAKAEDTATQYKQFFGAVAKGKDWMLNEIKESNVRGRGGAGFPMWIKLDGCAKQEANQKFIVCNADEGDPGAFTDRYLLEHQPHLVLIGMMAAGFISGANQGVLYIRAEYPESIKIMDEAIKEIDQLGYLGKNIQNTGFDFHFKVIHARGAYICGEETSLLSSIEGQRAEVRVRPPYPVESGLFNKPTIVNNVETLACIPFILKNGGAVFAAIGNGKSTGTKLLSLDSFFNNPGVYEVPMGTPLSKVVNELGGGFKSNIKALHIGGPLGGLVPVHKINNLAVDFESFANEGFLLGHASIICVPEDYSMAKYVQHLFEFTAHESCGKCFPCRLGSVRGAEMFEKAQKEDYKIDRTLLNDLLETMEEGSLCALGGGVPLPIQNALEYFDDELKQYLSEKETVNG